MKTKILILLTVFSFSFFWSQKDHKFLDTPKLDIADRSEERRVGKEC